jgi:hypothetical protein
MDSMSPDATTTPDDGRLARGRARMRQLTKQYAIEHETLTAEILASLGRPASAIDRIAAANLAALHIRANRIEAAGRDASAIRQQITQAVRATGFKPQPAAPQKSADPSASAVEWLSTFKTAATDGGAA